MNVFAEDVNYWKTSKSSPDKWIERTKKIIEDVGGSFVSEGFGSAHGSAAYMIAFVLEGERFKVVWPVLPTKSGGDEYAAKVQATTLMYHDIKARAVSLVVLGAVPAFFSFWVLPTTGLTPVEMSNDVLVHALDVAFGRPALPAPEGDYDLT